MEATGLAGIYEEKVGDTVWGYLLDRRYSLIERILYIYSDVEVASSLIYKMIETYIPLQLASYKSYINLNLKFKFSLLAVLR